jgi:hypothetical protein
MTVADYPDWQTPQAHATQIAATGVPLLRNIDVLNTTAVVNAGTTGGPFAQAYASIYEGYVIEVIPQNPGTRVFAADLVITHLDASNNPVAIEQVTVSNWANVGNNTSIVRGRLLGTSLTVKAQVANTAWLTGVTGGGPAADNVTIRFCGLQTYVPGTGKRVPIITAAGGLLLASSNVVPLGGVSGVNTLVAVLPDYTGPVIVSSSTGAGGGFTYQPRIASYTVSNGTAALSSQEFPQVTIAAPLVATFSLGSAFNVASVTQRSTVSTNGGFAVTVASADQ